MEGWKDGEKKKKRDDLCAAKANKGGLCNPTILALNSVLTKILLTPLVALGVGLCSGWPMCVMQEPSK